MTSSKKTADDFYEHNPDEDPLTEVEVAFQFTAGMGRSVRVSIAGKHMEFD